MHLGDLDLNLLRVLDALLQEGSVTGAARRVGLSQSATSHALARLRRALEDPLLVRHQRGFGPTVRAAELAQPLREALTLLERVAAPPAAFDPRTAQRTFTIATSDYTEFVLLPKLVQRLTEIAPGVSVWMRPFVAAEERAAVAEAADVVVGLRIKGSSDGNIVSRRLFSERFVCVVRPDHPALSKRWTPQTFTELGHAFVALRGTPGGAVDDALKRLGLERRVVVAVPHFLVAPFIVKDTDLVLTLPERMAHAFSRHVPLAILEPPFPLPGFTIEISWHQRVHLDPAHVWFREQVIAVAKDA